MPGDPNRRGSIRLSARLRRVGLGLALLVVVQELAARAVFPLPEVLNFQRLAYARGAALPAGVPPPSLAHMCLWWWSEPDGAWFARKANLYGFQGDEWSLHKRSGRTRVAFFGDSFVEGLGTPDGETISAGFARLAHRGGLDVEALNFGAGGFGLREYLPLIRDAVQLFHPDDVVLVVYMNDVYDIPEVDGLLGGSFEPVTSDPWRPRLAFVVGQLRAGRRVALRWREPASADPKPLVLGPRFEADPQLVANIDRFVEPEIAAAMKAGRLNPAITNLLLRSERVLTQPIELGPQVAALKRYCELHSARLWVVYLPSLNQVTDAYLPYQRRLSAPISVPSLTAEPFQRHARDLSRACTDAGAEFLDLTPALAREEDAGHRLYWSYDGHMRQEGYAVVAREIFAWWSGERERGGGG